jgi:UPF0755 protein
MDAGRSANQGVSVSDSDWRDPFADDEAARERAARRAERAAQRRQRQEEARESLGGRVEELTGERLRSDHPPKEPPAPAPTAVQTLEAPPREGSPPTPPPRRPPSASRIRQRRTALLIGLGALIVAVAGAGVIISRAGDDPVEPAPARAAGKTLEITIPEGLSRPEIAKITKKAGLDGDYEKATVSSKSFDLKKYGAEDAESLEGFLFPATYEVFKRDGVEGLVEKQLDAFEQNIKEVDMTYADRNGLSVYEVVNVASMVEREIQVAEERELASSVIYNRLTAGNPIGIDATIRFEDGNWTEPLVESRLNEATPYNTRINPGLPPSPIGNPGLASLEAAANPADTDFFYYVIKPGTCNEHTFVETDAEFQAAEAEYQAALAAEGGSPTDC